MATYTLFIDCEKTSEMMYREKMLAILEARNVGKELVSTIKALYNWNTCVAVNIGNLATEQFMTNLGLR
jgi:hypothetical protein